MANSLLREAMELASYHEFGCNSDFPKRYCGQCDRCVLAQRIVKLVQSGRSEIYAEERAQADRFRAALMGIATYAECDGVHHAEPCAKCDARRALDPDEELSPGVWRMLEVAGSDYKGTEIRTLRHRAMEMAWNMGNKFCPDPGDALAARAIANKQNARDSDLDAIERQLDEEREP